MPEPLNTENVSTLIAKINAGTATRCDIDDVFGDTRAADKAMAAYNGSSDAAEYLNDHKFPGWSMFSGHREIGAASMGLRRIQPNCDYKEIPLQRSQTLGRAWLLALLHTLM